LRSLRTWRIQKLGSRRAAKSEGLRSLKRLEDFEVSELGWLRKAGVEGQQGNSWRAWGPRSRASEELNSLRAKESRGEGGTEPRKLGRKEPTRTRTSGSRELR